jgi:SAM-dependent methyltransferase
MKKLDNPSRLAEIRRIIQGKAALRRFYEDVYKKYGECLERCPRQGKVLELGSGAGFVKEVIPEVITSDILPYQNVDMVADATHLSFPDESLRCIYLLNVFHHIPDVGSFLLEAQRCLVPGGRLFIVDHHMGYISMPLLKYMHHEPFELDAKDWQFDTTGPLSGANSALAWIVFCRDLKKYQQLCPRLKLVAYQPHTPLQYWMSGGLKRWNLIPDWAIDFVINIDKILIGVSSKFGSFVNIELLKE